MCPSCGSAGTLRRELDGGDFSCWMCGTVVYASPPLPVVSARKEAPKPRPDLRRNGNGRFPELSPNLAKSPLHSSPKVYNDGRRVAKVPISLSAPRVSGAESATLHGFDFAAGCAEGRTARRPDASLEHRALERMAEMTSQPKQHNSGSAAPPASRDKKFGAKVVKARERQKLQRSKLCFQMHAARCDVEHPEPFRQRSWPEACQKAADALWNRVRDIEAGKRDPEIEAELAQRLGLKAPAPEAAVEAE